MYAVIASGGKQYKVASGETIKLEKLPGEVGDKLELPVIMVVDDKEAQLGAAINYKVNAEVVSHGRGEKIKIIKFRRRKHSRKQMGHRQYFTEVKVVEIVKARGK